jgi:hypothetical protein
MLYPTIDNQSRKINGNSLIFPIAALFAVGKTVPSGMDTITGYISTLNWVRFSRSLLPDTGAGGRDASERAVGHQIWTGPFPCCLTP